MHAAPPTSADLFCPRAQPQHLACLVDRTLAPPTRDTAPGPQIYGRPQGSGCRHCTQISPQRAAELETAVAAAAEASPTDSLVLSPRMAAAVRNPASLASQVLTLTLITNLNLTLTLSPRTPTAAYGGLESSSFSMSGAAPDMHISRAGPLAVSPAVTCTLTRHAHALVGVLTRLGPAAFRIAARQACLAASARGVPQLYLFSTCESGGSRDRPLDAPAEVRPMAVQCCSVDWRRRRRCGTCGRGTSSPSRPSRPGDAMRGGCLFRCWSVRHQRPVTEGHGTWSSTPRPEPGLHGALACVMATTEGRRRSRVQLTCIGKATLEAFRGCTRSLYLRGLAGLGCSASAPTYSRLHLLHRLGANRRLRGALRRLDVPDALEFDEPELR